MPALQVRDFPEELFEQLRAYAAANHRSMAQQTIIAVEQVIKGVAVESASVAPAIDFDTEAKREARIKKYRELFKRIDASNERILARRGGEPIPEGLATQWIREDRDDNHGHEIDFAVLQPRREGEPSCS